MLEAHIGGGEGGEGVLSPRMMTEINKCFHHESLLVSIIRLSELGTHQHTKDEWYVNS